MKNVTLSIPDELLRQSREYARIQGTSLNEFVRTLLRQVVQNQETSTAEGLLKMSETMSVKTKSVKWSRNEIYDRKVFS